MIEDSENVVEGAFDARVSVASWQMVGVNSFGLSFLAGDFQGDFLVEDSEDAAAVVSGNWEGADVFEGVSDAEVAVGDSEDILEGALNARVSVAFCCTNIAQDRFTLFFAVRFLLITSLEPAQLGP